MSDANYRIKSPSLSFQRSWMNIPQSLTKSHASSEKKEQLLAKPANASHNVKVVIRVRPTNDREKGKFRPYI
jgi:hypothetical protein